MLIYRRTAHLRIFPRFAYLLCQMSLGSASSKCYNKCHHCGVARTALDAIPVVIDFDVCMVQQVGEPLCAAEDRAIRLEHLVPIYVSSFSAFRGVRPLMILYLFSYLMRMRRIRVKNVDEGLTLMGERRICGRVPTLGARISLLKCGHAFHSHCLVTWLQEDASRPKCGAKESLQRASLQPAWRTGDDFKRKSAVFEENCP